MVVERAVGQRQEREPRHVVIAAEGGCIIEDAEQDVVIGCGVLAAVR